jgi:hypothetical protein
MASHAAIALADVTPARPFIYDIDDFLRYQIFSAYASAAFAMSAAVIAAFAAFAVAGARAIERCAFAQRCCRYASAPARRFFAADLPRHADIFSR